MMSPKWQAAHTIGTTYKFWVRIGAPSEPMELREIASDGSHYLAKETGRFYSTNLLNPVETGPRLVFVRHDQTELLDEFADNVPEDNQWWK